MADRFQAMYLEGPPPWDIGRAQPEFVELVDSGRIAGRVLDIGCGTGDNALHFASAGFDVVGVDGAPEAIRQAREKAQKRGVPIRFDVGDVLRLDEALGSFDNATDSGVFHVFEDADRPRYERSVHRVLRAGGHLFLLCFSEHEPGDWGPRRVTQPELRATFGAGWRIESIDAAQFATRLEERRRVEAWLATLTHL